MTSYHKSLLCAIKTKSTTWPQQTNQLASSDKMAASFAPHLSKIRSPFGGEKVYKDECVYSFDSPVSQHCPSGIAKFYLLEFQASYGLHPTACFAGWGNLAKPVLSANANNIRLLLLRFLLWWVFGDESIFYVIVLCLIWWCPTAPIPSPYWLLTNCTYSHVMCTVVSSFSLTWALREYGLVWMDVNWGLV